MRLRVRTAHTKMARLLLGAWANVSGSKYSVKGTVFTHEKVNEPPVSISKESDIDKCSRGRSHHHY
jgi:hypothetical protein